MLAVTAVWRIGNREGIAIVFLSMLASVISTILLSRLAHPEHLPAVDDESAMRVASGGIAEPLRSERPQTQLLTRSGLYAAPPIAEIDEDSNSDPGTGTGDFSIRDIVNRLEPASYRWIESSPAEYQLLGWSTGELRQKSFLDIVYTDDRPRAEGALRLALDRGEALGAIIRIRTALGEMRAVELNVGSRYGQDHVVRYLRCHLTDVTEKVRAERELRLRTRELTRLNEQLRRINRELEELKDRYGDLYQNAPTMYFSLDQAGKVVECNSTMIHTLGRLAEDLVGRPLDHLMGDELTRARYRARLPALLGRASAEFETRWLKADGGAIDVWIKGTPWMSKGGVEQTRCVAQDMTARNRLEAELQEKNHQLAEKNAKLTRKNRELDEFVYVVSHDLQEPLRTTLAFSEFLLRDHGANLSPQGQEYIHHLIGASRRMRDMTQGLLNLSRAGDLTGEFGPVDLAELTGVVRTDLRELLRRCNAELRIVSPLGSVWGDRSRLEQLFVNLIANGIKYNQSERPLVEIGVVEGAKGTHDAAGDAEPLMTLFFKDNGIGIDPKHHRKIFQLFRRLHASDEYEGTGVGLAISSKIVEAHGGRIHVDSASGQGATFFVTLRTSSTLPAADPSVRPD